jgi:hypothetical protein
MKRIILFFCFAVLMLSCGDSAPGFDIGLFRGSSFWF